MGGYHFCSTPIHGRQSLARLISIVIRVKYLYVRRPAAERRSSSCFRRRWGPCLIHRPIIRLLFLSRLSCFVSISLDVAPNLAHPACVTLSSWQQSYLWDGCSCVWQHLLYQMDGPGARHYSCEICAEIRRDRVSTFVMVKLMEILMVK